MVLLFPPYRQPDLAGIPVLETVLSHPASRNVPRTSDDYTQKHFLLLIFIDGRNFKGYHHALRSECISPVSGTTPP